MYEKTKRTTASRYGNQRMHYDADTIHPILDEALFCTVSYAVDNQPFSIQTGFVRQDNWLYIHGSVGSHFIRQIETGIPVCISIMLADALVVAKSAFNHSVNYRSVVMFSKAVKIDDFDKKSLFFKELTEKMVPGSWDYLRPMKDKEVHKTTLLAFEMVEVSAKVRAGAPMDEDEDADLPIWTGLIPLGNVRGPAETAADSMGVEMPPHLR